MKISNVVILLSIIITVGVSSCSKKSDDVTPNSTTTPQTNAGFQVKIDGKTYAPDFAYALANNPGTTGYYAIYGLDSKTSDVVFVSLPNTTAEGTYPLSNVNIGGMSFNNETYSTVNGGSGTVTKKTATNIIGTFSFTAYDANSTSKRALTEGTFNVPVR